MNLCALLVAGCLALTPAPSVDAARVVQMVEKRYRSASTLKAFFLERYSEDGRVVRVEAGTVYFRRPGRMRWEYESPEPKLFVADGKTAWFYVPADRTVTRARMKESADWRTPLALLTEKVKLARLCGQLDLTSALGTPPGHAVLRCVPRGAAANGSRGAADQAAAPAQQNEPVREVLLEVDATRGELVRVVVRQPGGVELEYRFGNWQENLPLPESLFHFQPPAGVAIVDEASVGAPSR